MFFAVLRDNGTGFDISFILSKIYSMGMILSIFLVLAFLSDDKSFLKEYASVVANIASVFVAKEGVHNIVMWALMPFIVFDISDILYAELIVWVVTVFIFLSLKKGMNKIEESHFDYLVVKIIQVYVLLIGVCCVFTGSILAVVLYTDLGENFEHSLMFISSLIMYCCFAVKFGIFYRGLKILKADQAIE